MSSEKNIIGLTGLYCSGKSTAEKTLINSGFLSIDVDKIGHQVLVQKKKELINYFGDEILTDSQINRKKLGEIVFNSKIKLNQLNSILHPVMTEKVKKIIKKAKEKKICINASLLFEMNLNKICKSIIIIKSSFCNIVKRAKKRDGYSIFKVIKILLSQKVLSLAKKNKSFTDIFYIYNNNSQDNLIDKVKILLGRIRG